MPYFGTKTIIFAPLILKELVWDKMILGLAFSPTARIQITSRPRFSRTSAFVSVIIAIFPLVYGVSSCPWATSKVCSLTNFAQKCQYAPFHIYIDLLTSLVILKKTTVSNPRKRFRIIVTSAWDKLGLSFSIRSQQNKTCSFSITNVITSLKI